LPRPGSRRRVYRYFWCCSSSRYLCYRRWGTARQYQAGVGHCGITHADCRSGHCVRPASAADDWHCGGDSHIDISMDRVGVPGRYSLAWNDGWTIAAILVIDYILLVQVFRAGPIHAVRIQGAVAEYLLLEVAYAHGYQIAEYFNASSVTNTEGPMTRLSIGSTPAFALSARWATAIRARPAACWPSAKRSVDSSSWRSLSRG